MSVSGNSGEKNQISVKQRALIDALIAGNSIVFSAKVADISERTAHRWLKETTFKAAYRSAKQEVFDEKLEEIKDGIHTALEALRRNMREDAREYVQVQAASKWLDIAIELYKSQELEDRMKELEDTIKDMQR